MEDFDQDLADNQEDISTSGLHMLTYFQSRNPNKPEDKNHNVKWQDWMRIKMMQKINANFLVVVSKHVTSNGYKSEFFITDKMKYVKSSRRKLNISCKSKNFRC